MEKCVIDLLSAVTQVSLRYAFADGTRIDGTQYPQFIENSFTAELYHNYRNIIEMPANREYYNNLIFHFDITKFGGGMRPDLVLHEAQENRNNQKMFIEVKTNPTVNLNQDYSKLKRAITELEFENAVLVTFNRDMNRLKDDVFCYLGEQNTPRHLFHNVSLINVVTNDDKVQYQIESII